MQDANTDNQDAPEISPTHTKELTPTLVDGQQQSQLEVPLKRSTRERRSMISNDYIVYLEEEFDIGLEDDLVSFT
ncbi:hypothetical protein AAG906_012068 [Vitis piasezkii]